MIKKSCFSQDCSLVLYLLLCVSGQVSVSQYQSARLEAFRALKLSGLESFRALDVIFHIGIIM